MRAWWLAGVLVACGAPSGIDGGFDAGPLEPDAGADEDGGSEPDAGVHDAGGLDAGAVDAGAPDAGRPVPPVRVQASLFFSDAGFVDDASVVSFAKLMRLASRDGHGGQLLSDWFHRFATTAHSERALPAQFIDEVARQQGADPTRWDLARLPFVVTGVHNRIDLASLEPGGHCGELRVSVASVDPTLQPFHMLFLFRQPLGPGDVVANRVTCEGTARRWAELSALDGPALDLAMRARLAEGLTAERFEQIETVEQSLSPWEWRQWVPTDAGFENPPLFQQVDVPELNRPSPKRDAFVRWVEANAASIEARGALVPPEFRPQSTRAAAFVMRPPLSLQGVDAGVLAAFPTLRAQLELVGCTACHTADADFVQTRADRTISPFYAKELEARARHLESLARGEAPRVPFGPLQSNPVLP